MLLIRSDLDFILSQILQSETHTPIADPSLPFGLRTVDGTGNSMVSGQYGYGAADHVFPRLTDPEFRAAESGTTYEQVLNDSTVTDPQPRIISNLIVDQNGEINPAARAADGNGGGLIVNVAPDADAAPFNQWFTLFGQFFDHGLDLVNKGKNGSVIIPLQPDDPLYVAGSHENFMVLTRATNQPGPDGIVGTDDDIHEHMNQTTPFIDQNQTYTSHPSHQVFLREYALDAGGKPVATGALLDHAGGGLPTWGDIKAQARTMLGIMLTDEDVTNIPLLATDEYGQFIRGPNGFAQLVLPGPDGLAGTDDDGLVDGNPSAPASTTGAAHTGHAFLDDIAHDAVPTGKVADGDIEVSLANLDGSDTSGNYDNELLDAHFITGDGRGNEDIGLTAVHHVFHAEHNRLLDQMKDLIRAEIPADPDFVRQWLRPGADLADGIQAREWNGERLFQAARFGAEMQYQHLVFENFARRIQPNIDAFEAYDVTIDPAITAEFAHTVYRFGHSLLRETVDRIDADGNLVDADPTTVGDQQLSLVSAFLNPVAYAQRGVSGAAAAEIVRGATHQAGNEIDEFVTGALRNNVLGLPLDLAALNLARGRDTGVPPLNKVREQFFDGTGDADLKPYENWAEFGGNIRHPESLINFIAAYGIHPLLDAATMTAEKRAAATAIVEGRDDDPDTPENESAAPDTDFLNGTGDFAARETGLDDIDLWIGGLAEKPLASGGLLGSTFNFVFETQMESLQSGDRFYYLSRLEGTNFLTQLEGTSFSELVMRNTGAKHLPFDVFSVPADTIEAGDPSTDPAGGSGKVVRSAGWVSYDGTAHVVMGGTERDDQIRSGAGDDTLWGDGGDDVLVSGVGDDALIGGDGDDRMSGEDGDDFLRGAGGNDSMEGGRGADLLVGLEGRDHVRAGDGDDEVFGGLDNDRIDGDSGDDDLLGNEGDDWIKGGEGNDHLVGDNGNPFGAPLADTDTAAFSGRLCNYTITHNADGTLTVTDKVGKNGTDTLLNIERLQFSDRSILVDGGLSLREPSTANSATHDPAADFAEVGDASTDAQPIAGAASGKALVSDPLHSNPSPHPLSFGQGDVILA
ncbi:peroxidase family protein [Microvirga tunisiensis]|nr:peroxidase family protein [Microvirga tunisiensis]